MQVIEKNHHSNNKRDLNPSDVSPESSKSNGIFQIVESNLNGGNQEVSSLIAKAFTIVKESTWSATDCIMKTLNQYSAYKTDNLNAAEGMVTTPLNLLVAPLYTKYTVSSHLKQLEQDHDENSYQFIKEFTDRLKTPLNNLLRGQLKKIDPYNLLSVFKTEGFIQSSLITLISNLMEKSSLPKPEEGKRFTGSPSAHLHSAFSNIFAPYKSEYEELSRVIKQQQLKVSDINDQSGISKELDENKEKQRKIIREKIAPDFFEALLGQNSAKAEGVYSSAGILQEMVKYLNIPEKKLTDFFEGFFPFLFLSEMDEQEKILDENPEATTIKNGIKFLNSDLLNFIFEKLELGDSLQANLKELLSPYLHLILIKLANNFSQIDTETAMQILDAVITTRPAVASQNELENPEAAIRAKLLLLNPKKEYEEYVQELNLSPEITSEQNQRSLRKKLKAMYREENEKTAQQLVDRVLDLTNLNNLENIGLPSILAEIAKEKLKSTLPSLVNEYLFAVRVDLKQMDIVPFKSDSIAGTTLKVSTLNTVISNTLQEQLAKKLNVNVRESNHYSWLVNLLAKSLGEQCESHKEKFSLLSFLAPLFKQGNLSPFIEKVISLVDVNTEKGAENNAITLSANAEVVKLIQPLIVTVILKALTPILEKEKKEGAAFDQSLALIIMTSLNNYFQKLNQIDQYSEREVASAEQQSKKEFYIGSSDKLIKHFLPKGIESLQELFPNLDPELFKTPWDKIQAELPDQLQEIKNLIFDKEIFKDALIELYSVAIQALNDRSEVVVEKKNHILSLEESRQHDEMKTVLGELIFNGGALTDLPITTLLKTLHYLPGGQDLIDVSLRSMVNSIQKKLDGKLIAESMDTALKSHLKASKASSNKKPDNKNLQLDKLEKELVKSTLSYGMWSKSKAIDEFLSKLDFPLVKQIKNAIVAVVRFLLYKVLFGFLNACGLHRLAVYVTTSLLRRNRVKLQNSLADSDKHEAIVHETINLVIKLMQSDWSGKATTASG